MRPWPPHQSATWAGSFPLSLYYTFRPTWTSGRARSPTFATAQP